MSRTPDALRTASRAELDAFANRFLAEKCSEFADLSPAAAAKRQSSRMYRQSKAGTVKRDGQFSEELKRRAVQAHSFYNTHRSKIDSITPLILSKFQNDKTRRAVVQIMDDLPYADIGKNVGFSRRYIYMLRDKYRNVLKEIGSGVNRDAKTLFEYYWMPTAIHRRPKKSNVLTISRSSTQQKILALL